MNGKFPFILIIPKFISSELKAPIKPKMRSNYKKPQLKTRPADKFTPNPSNFHQIKDILLHNLDYPFE